MNTNYEELNIKDVADLSFKLKNTKDKDEKEKIDKQLKESLTKLKEKAIQKFKDEKDLKIFLDNILKFNNYSFNNQLLILAQKPNAQYVAPFSFYSKLGYVRKKGEKAIKILTPVFLTYVKIEKSDKSFNIKPLFSLTEEELKRYKDKNDETVTYHNEKLSYFKVGNVFDISQTNMPIEMINEQLNPTLEDIDVKDKTDVFIKSIYRNGFKIIFEDYKDTCKGYCDFKNKRIVIKKGLSSLMKLKVIVHEYAHALAHQHLENNHKQYIEERGKYECEAETIAYLTLKYLNLDTSNYSINYLYSYCKDNEFKQIDDSLNTIVNYTKKIINNYQKMLEKNIYLEKQNIKI